MHGLSFILCSVFPHCIAASTKNTLVSFYHGHAVPLPYILEVHDGCGVFSSPVLQPLYLEIKPCITMLNPLYYSTSEIMQQYELFWTGFFYLKINTPHLRLPFPPFLGIEDLSVARPLIWYSHCHIR
jgi:hypothetical protein